jgi:DNA-binding response OmpR family regulator
MKILVMDDTRKRRNQIKEEIVKKGHEVTECFTSNEFMNRIGENKAELILLDADTWKKGKSIYNYFRIAKKMENIPVVFYNSEDDNMAIPERSGNERDLVLSKPTEIEAVLDRVQRKI